MGRVGHREALVLALAPSRGGGGGGGGGGGSGGGGPCAAPQQQPGKLPGVKDEGLRAALGRLSVSVNEVGAEMPMLGRAGGAGLAPII